MSVYTQLVSKLLFPLHELLKKHTSVAVRKELEQSQWWSREELEALRINRLKALLQNARAHVPYYRNLFDELQFDPDEVDSLDWLQKLPLMTKDTIRANTDDLKADNATGLQRFNTGGSTGEPLIFYIGKERVSHDVAAKWRATRWW
ncbi:MAG: phenylacetate--CoA ligase, partial [Gammaproteobacteria bacterium]|nr:phenylacetate--CoA ligase [Gammaproteobacteria bacterium]